MKDGYRPDLEAVLDHYGVRVIPSSGAWQKATCPLNEHEDGSPSASVNLEAGKWKCFGCDERGDGVDIVRANEGLAGFAEALEFCKENFAGSDRGVLAEPGDAGKYANRPRNLRGGGKFVPAWRRY